jgi:class 3 adenylate cyclase
VAQLIIDVLDETGDEDEHIPSAKVRVGIDSGIALAVNNGRNGGREPLFLGDPANFAAKFSAAGSAKGIFLTNSAREAIGLDAVDNPEHTALAATEIESSEQAADLGVTVAKVVSDLKNRPIGSFEFSRHTPPLRTLDITNLTPSNSRRQDAVSLYADLDNFTSFVSSRVNDNPEDVVRVLHVIRAEMDRVLTSDFDGRRIRFIGDCMHGLLCEGTSQTTNDRETVSTATLCAGALRSSFDLALEKLQDEDIGTSGLGLQIGFEFGPMTVTRLGMQGNRIRCSVSRGVRRSEAEQQRCNAAETAIGPSAYDAGNNAVRNLFGSSRKMSNLDYNEAVEALSRGDDEAAKESKQAAFSVAPIAVQRSSLTEVRPHADQD